MHSKPLPGVFVINRRLKKIIYINVQGHGRSDPTAAHNQAFVANPSWERRDCIGGYINVDVEAIMNSGCINGVNAWYRTQGRTATRSTNKNVEITDVPTEFQQANKTWGRPDGEDEKRLAALITQFLGIHEFGTHDLSRPLDAQLEMVCRALNEVEPDSPTDTTQVEPDRSSSAFLSFCSCLDDSFPADARLDGTSSSSGSRMHGNIPPELLDLYRDQVVGKYTGKEVWQSPSACAWFCKTTCITVEFELDVLANGTFRGHSILKKRKAGSFVRYEDIAQAYPSSEVSLSAKGSNLVADLENTEIRRELEATKTRWGYETTVRIENWTVTWSPQTASFPSQARSENYGSTQMVGESALVAPGKIDFNVWIKIRKLGWDLPIGPVHVFLSKCRGQ